MKWVIFYFLFFLLSVPAHAVIMTSDTIANYYHLDLTHGDRASIYLSDDGTLMFVPDSANQDYIHNCWGGWKLDEKQQILSITGAKNCGIIRGTYHVHRLQNAIELNDNGKKLFLQYLNKR